MATGKKQRSANCRHVPEASELNRSDSRCLEVLSRSTEAKSSAWEHKIQLDNGLLDALCPEAKLSLCASRPVMCGIRVTEKLKTQVSR